MDIGDPKDVVLELEVERQKAAGLNAHHGRSNHLRRELRAKGDGNAACGRRGRPRGVNSGTRKDVVEPAHSSLVATDLGLPGANGLARSLSISCWLQAMWHVSSMSPEPTVASLHT